MKRKTLKIDRELTPKEIEELIEKGIEKCLEDTIP
jgi:hypothetical protein